MNKNSPMDVGMLVTMKKPNARKFLINFLALFDIIQKNDVRRLGDYKTKNKTTRIDSNLWSSINKQGGGGKKINTSVKQSL